MQYIVKDVKDFNLDHIFDCGQCFRWEKQEDESYVGAALGKVVRVSMPFPYRFFQPNYSRIGRVFLYFEKKR